MRKARLRHTVHDTPGITKRLLCILLKSIHACSLADDVEIPESEWTANLTRTIHGVDLSKESGRLWVLYKHTAAQQEIAAGESIKVLPYSV